MGQTQSVHYEIDINQQPDEVRVVVRAFPCRSIRRVLAILTYLTNSNQFLDFASYPKWFEHWSWVLDDASKSPSKLRPGDKLQCIYMGSSFDYIIVVSYFESRA
jgi:hypothetical protein